MKGMNQLICDRQKMRPTHGLCQSPILLRLWGVFASSQWGLKAGTWGLETKLRRKSAIGYEEAARGNEKEEIHSQEWHGRNPNCHRSKSLLLVTSHAGDGAIAAPLSLHDSA